MTEHDESDEREKEEFTSDDTSSELNETAQLWPLDEVIAENTIDIVDEFEVAEAELSRCQSIKEILKIVFPGSINEFIINGEFFVKTLIFSQIGTSELAASSLITTTQLLTVATAKAILISTNVFAARSSGNDDLLAAVLQQSWAQALLESAPLLIVLSFTKPIFDALRQPTEVAEIASEYLLYSNIALPATLLLQSNQMFAIGLKRPNLALISTIFSTTMTLGLSYLFAFGRLGFPELGMTGVAVGTAISTWVSFTGMALYLAKLDSQIKNLDLFRIRRESQNFVLSKMFMTGLPIGINVLSEFGSYFFMSIMVGMMGKNSLIAEQITTQYSGMLQGPVMATAMATDVLVGHDIAMHNARNIKRLASTGLVFAGGISFVGLLILSSAPRLLAKPFLDETDESYDEIISLFRVLCVIIGINNLGEALRNTSGGALRGFYDTAVPTLVTAVMFWIIGLPISYVMAFVAGWGTNGVFLGRGIGIFSTGAVLLDRWRRKSDDPARAIEDGTVGFLVKLGLLCSQIKNYCNDENVMPTRLDAGDEPSDMEELVPRIVPH